MHGRITTQGLHSRDGAVSCGQRAGLRSVFVGDRRAKTRPPHSWPIQLVVPGVRTSDAYERILRDNGLR